ncbi:hypothetical protein LPL65_11565 [Providencia huaxiensis]|uniref:tail fiber/spike domain-containing protein n=1 Tax=Providencia huaxiensis TaxID=2027290 RepID=UPI001E59A88F|nr:glycosyl hydrolase family 28-related protein [Providencia huaxiensis]MCD2528668.1 hypothetical protein [Providencia huaxiensis]
MREVKPTQKPVPSSDIKDLFFNSGLLDIWATSLEHKYIDRFGNCHLTAAGMEWIFNELVTKFKIESEQALLAAGYAPAGAFQEGAEVVSRNGTVLWKLPDGDGDHYRWDGDLPKQVPAGSTPQSTGGVGKGAWVSVGDASFRSDAHKIFWPLGLNISPETKTGFDVTGYNAITLSNVTYPISRKLNGLITEINLVAKPYHIVAGGKKAHLLDINWYAHGEIHSRSYWCATDGITSDSACLQAMIDDIEYVSDTQTAANIYFDKPDNVYLLTSPIYVYEKDYTKFTGQGAAITKFLLADNMTAVAPKAFRDLQDETGIVYNGVKAAFVVAARRRTQAPNQGYIPANQAAWGMKWSGMSFDAAGNSVYAAYGIYAPRIAIGSIIDVRMWRLRFGFFSKDCYLMYFNNCNFNTCRVPVQIDTGTSVVMDVVSASNCAYGFIVKSFYGVMNSVTNDHWGLDNNGVLQQDSYAFDLKGYWTLNGCGAELGYGGLIKGGYGLDDTTSGDSEITINSGFFLGGAYAGEVNYRDQKTLEDFGVKRWGYAVFSNCKVNWGTMNIRNAVANDENVNIRLPMRFINNSELNVNNFTGNTSRYVDISDLEVDNTSYINCRSVKQKPIVRAELSSEITLPANNTLAVNIPEIFDNLNNYDAGVFVVPVSGRYRLDFTVSYVGSGVSWAGVTGLSQNITVVNYQQSNYGCISFNKIVDLTKEQRLSFVVRTNESTAVKLLVGSCVGIEML